MNSDLNLISDASDYENPPINYEFFDNQNIEFIDNPFAEPSYKGNQKQNTYAKTSYSQFINIPRGASISIALDRTLSSAYSRIGEIAYGTVFANPMYGIPRGTIAELIVTSTNPAVKPFSKAGNLELQVNKLILPNGESMSISSKSINQKALSQRGKDSIKKIAIGTGVGAVSGLAIGALTKTGNLPKSTLIGAGIGLLIGGIWAANSKGEDIVLNAGQTLTLNTL